MAEFCGESKASMARMAKSHTVLHEGLPPDKFTCEQIPSRPRAVRVLGYVTDIYYHKDVPAGRGGFRTDRFWHEYAPHAWQKFGLDESGRLRFYAGRNTVMAGPSLIGITDLPRHRQSADRIPATPKRFTLLGRLEKILYKERDSQDAPKRTLRFAARDAPVLARDEHGNLHALRGRYDIDARSNEDTMARRSKRSRKHGAMSNPGHSRSMKRRSRRGRRNPTRAFSASGGRMSFPKRLMDTAVASLIIGGSTLAVGYGLERANPWLLANLPAMLRSSPYRLAATKAAAGVLAAAALASVPGRWASLASVAVGVGSIVAAGRDAFSYYLAQQAAAQLPPQQNPANPPSTSGGQLYGSLPYGYGVADRAACAIYS